MSTVIYRQEAIDAHAHIAALPKAMRATTGMARATALALFVSLAGAVAVSGFIDLPIQIAGSGIVVDVSGELLTPANATVSGFVEKIFVKAGDPVKPGEPLMRIHMPEEANGIEKATRELAGLVDDDRRISALDAQDEADEVRSRDQKAASLDAQIVRMDRRVDWLREREAAEQSLIDKGLSTQEKLLSAKVATQDAIDRLETAKDDRNKLFVQLSEATNRRKHDKLTRQLTIAQKQDELASLQQTSEERSIVRSASDGVVAEVAVGLGASVSPGQVLINVSPKALGAVAKDALVYVPLSKGKRVKVGDPVQMLLTSIDDKDRDRVNGRVIAVTQTAATRPNMLRQLGSEQLYAIITREGPVFEVTVELDRDPRGAGGLAWASGKGPEHFTLSLGTPLSAMVTIERSSLLSLMVPALRKLLDPQRDPWSAPPSGAGA